MAVYTEISDDELARFIDSYGLGQLLSYKGIAEGVENTNYLVHTTSGTYILTLYEKRVDPNDLPFFLGLMDHLSARGVTCPLPVRDKAGNMLNQIAGRHAAIITFLEGVWPRKPQAGARARGGQGHGAHAYGVRGLRTPPPQRARAFGLAAALRQVRAPRRRNSARHEQADCRRTRRPRDAMAARSARGRHPRRSLSRQRLFHIGQALRPDRLLFRLQ